MKYAGARRTERRDLIQRGPITKQRASGTDPQELRCLLQRHKELRELAPDTTKSKVPGPGAGGGPTRKDPMPQSVTGPDRESAGARYRERQSSNARYRECRERRGPIDRENPVPCKDCRGPKQRALVSRHREYRSPRQRPPRTGLTARAPVLDGPPAGWERRGPTWSAQGLDAQSEPPGPNTDYMDSGQNNSTAIHTSLHHWF